MIINRSFSSSLLNKERFGSLKSLVLLVVIAILATSNTYAQASFETIDGLRYLIDSDAKTAMLTANPNGEKYSGNIVVPEKIKASDGVEYPVTAFGSNAFKDCDGLKSIIIPSSVTSTLSVFLNDTEHLAVLNFSPSKAYASHFFRLSALFSAAF